MAAGSIGVSVYLTNVSGSRCVLLGYPDLQMLTATNRLIPTMTHHGPAMTVPSIKARPVSLAPGGSATFYTGYSDVTGYGANHCPISTRVAITPPRDKTAIVIDWRLSLYGGSVQHVQCGGVNVSPVIAGIHRRP